MAVENIVKLLEAADASPELAAKLEAVTGPEQVVQIGAEEGLDFTTEEAEAFRQKLIELQQRAESGAELTDDELEDVAGGALLGVVAGYAYKGYTSSDGSLKGTAKGAYNAAKSDVKTAINAGKSVVGMVSKVISGW
jgi:predicted ribosomally synthesized peptide with nif11-like leader